jgi:arylsulfatase A-like enzyme
MVLCSILGMMTQVVANPSKPNIVLIFVDDWAWNGSPIRMDDQMANSAMPVLRMPNLERLAHDGMKFRNAYYKSINKTAGTINARQDPATWLGMGEDLDGRIGAVMQTIKDLGIEDNTYVIVTSDNGYRHKFFPGQKQPLHGAKWWVWQGGCVCPWS